MLVIRLVVTLTVLSSLVAQGLQPRDASRIPLGMTTYDLDRARLVELGTQGETREFDGTKFFLRPGVGPRLFGAMVYRSAARRSLAHGVRLDDTTLTFVAGTWEYDGAAWYDVTPPGPLPGTGGVSMAYDEQRDRVVAFGGSPPAAGLPGTTWEWDGTNWSVRATTGPLARVAASMAYDAIRGVCVLFGGQVTNMGRQNDHWEWDGTSWTQRTLASVPSVRKDAAMAYDWTRGVTVLYGGTGLSTATASELWEFDGATWQQIAFGAGPGDRYDADMVFDAHSGTVMLASMNLTTRERDYWRWDGASWQLAAATPTVPPQTRYASSAFEPISGSVLMIGSLFWGETWRLTNGQWSAVGSSGPGARTEPILWSDSARTWLFGGTNYFGSQTFNDTWSWNGAAWQLHATAAAPPARNGATVAYDTLRNEAVLFGGAVSLAAPDTWTFDGTTWQQRFPSNMPPGRLNPGMAYDPGRDRVVMFGGLGSFSQPRNDTWEWDGNNWTAIVTPQSPPAYRAAAMEFDPAGNRIVMTVARETYSLTSTLVEGWTYDGLDWTPLPLLGSRVAGSRHALIRSPASGELLLVDTMGAFAVVDQPPTVAALGTGCGVPPPIVTAREVPTVDNANFGIDLLSATPSSLAILAGSANATSQPLLGCTLLVGPPQVSVTLATNAAGFATRDVPIPNQPALLGTSWYFQAAMLQPSAPTAVAFSAALAIGVGDK